MQATWSKFIRLSLVIVLLGLAVFALAPHRPVAAQGGSTLVIYSGRSENLVGPFIEQFEKDTGVDVEVRYGDSAELALQILEEGENSPADVFFSQDAGALGAVEAAELFSPLSADILDLVEPRFQSAEGFWIGITGRARAFVYNSDTVDPETLPASILDFTDSAWQGRLGWAPTNGSFQSFVTALRVTQGEEVAKEWLESMIANEIAVYPNNDAIVDAVAKGEIDGGFVNHYYIFEYGEEHPDAPIALYHFPNQDIGSMINAAGVGILASSENQILAQRFILYSLSLRGQSYFVEHTGEYPLLRFGEFELPEGVTPMEEIDSPELNLGDLGDLQATLELLEETGALTGE
jgi:iron(III) transport system substrate-binding protein